MPLCLISVLYFLIAYLARNTRVLVFAILALAGWLGAETGYVSGWGAYFLGMNYPARFAPLSPYFILAGYGHERLRRDWAESFASVYYSMGLLYLNLSLWIISIFRNHGSMVDWHEAGKL